MAFNLTPYELLTEIQKELLDEAEKVMETAYNPYSNFYVGAAVLTRDNKIVTGTNVENKAYSEIICAERAAILRARSNGHKTYKSIAIIAKGKDFDTEKVTGPCGACRQVIYEFAQVSEHNLEIIMSTTRKDKIVIATIEELLPLAFGPKDLGINVEKYR